MKTSIQELEKKFTKFSEHEQSFIKGGTGPIIEGGALTNAQLQQLFNYSGLAPAGETGAQAQADGFNSTLGKAWNVVIQNMNYTSLGHAVLSSILSASAPAIELKNMLPTSGTAEYSKASQNTDGQPQLKIGIINNYKDFVTNSDVYLDSTLVLGAAMNVAVHEMYHAYEDLAKHDLTSSVSSEIQAYLFADMVDTQFDQKTFSINYTISGTENLKENTDSTFTTTEADMVLSKHFTLSDYNTLVNDFKTTVLGQNYTNSTVDPITNLATNDLYNLFQSNYNTTPIPTIPSVPGSSTVLEWYNPKTGQFEVTGVGQSPDSGFIFSRSNNSIITQAASYIMNGRVNDAPVGVLYQAEQAAVIAATNKLGLGLSQDQINGYADAAATTVINNYNNGQPAPGPGGPAPVDYLYIFDFITGSVSFQPRVTPVGPPVITPTPTGTGVTKWVIDDGSPTGAIVYTTPSDPPPTGGIFLESDDKVVQDAANTAYSDAISLGSDDYSAGMIASEVATTARYSELQGKNANQVTSDALDQMNASNYDWGLTDSVQGTDEDWSSEEMEEYEDYGVASF